jgi:hypothetical protein
MAILGLFAQLAGILLVDMIPIGIVTADVLDVVATGVFLGIPLLALLFWMRSAREIEDTSVLGTGILGAWFVCSFLFTLLAWAATDM